MSVLSNGFLLALTAGPSSVDFDAEFLVIAGGGARASTNYNGRTIYSGGGAGGYISSVSGESSGGGASALAAVGLTTEASPTYSITVGTAGSNSIFSGTNTSSTSFNHTAIAGGAGGGGSSAGSSGGSGGGSGAESSDPSGGDGTTNQGYRGGSGDLADGSCLVSGNHCYAPCRTTTFGGAGGGAGGVPSGGPSVTTGYVGGAGVQSSITGTATYYAAGGSGNFICSTSTQPTLTPGYDNYGGGAGYTTSSAQPGVVILRYPNTVTISNPGGGLTLSTSTDGSDKVTTITAGTGNISFEPA